MSEFPQYTITPLDGSTVTGNMTAAGLIDTRFGEVEDALDDLSSRIYSLNTRSAIVRHDVPLDSDVFPGALVYFNTSKSLFCNAQALTLAETTASGMTIEAPNARVEGIILSTNNGSPLTGTMLCGGYWEDSTVTTACLGSNASPGTYYLSPILAGHATTETYGHLRQPVLSYYGNGKFSMTLFYMAHDNHFHSSQNLTGTWGPVSVTIDDRQANFVYTGELDPGLGALGDTTAVFYDGILQVPGATNSAFVIYNNKLYYMDTPAPAGLVTIFNHYPFAYGSSVVRTITSTNDALTVKNENGQVTLTANDFTQGATNKSALAVYAISGKELQYTPVVTDVLAGPGIVVSRAMDGSAYVSAANTVGGLMDAYSINHNGTTLITDGTNLQYITFPAGRVAQFVMYLPVNGLTSNCQVSVWAIKAGMGSAELNVVADYIQNPTMDTESVVTLSNNTGLLDLPGGDSADSLTYYEAAITGCTATGSGMLVATVSVPAAPAKQIKLLRAGFKLTAIAGNAEYTEPIVDSNAITQTMTVAPNQTIAAGDALMISNGMLAKCTNVKNGIQDNTNKCVGIAITGATAGQELQYMITGTMTLVVSGATAGQSLYVGPYAELKAVTDIDAFWHGDANNPGVNFLQKVGTALTGSKIQVSIEPAVKGQTT